MDEVYSTSILNGSGHSATHTPVVDVLGIGFGPSNLALAIAVMEHNERGGFPLTARFMERKPRFSWHPGMLIEGATMQVSFLKDLVTLRDPTSRFSFLSYLKDKDRLIDFINHKIIYPSRVEFHDYLSWCADQAGELVDYGCEVVSGRPVERDGYVTHYEVTYRTGRPDALQVDAARNLVVAPGLRPRMPVGITAGERIWHSHTLLQDVAAFGVREPRRFVVLGAGQSAAETVDYLHRTFPSAEVYSVFARYGYSQAEDSPFANRIFDPGTVDVFHAAPPPVKEMLTDYHANTNYSVVDVNLVEELYRRHYQERVQGVERLRLLNVSQLVDARHRLDGVEVTVHHLPSGGLSTLEADALVCATGYDATPPLSLLSDVAPLLLRDAEGRLQVERDYRVATGPAVLGGVYLCGATEHSHGITSSLLSMAAVRAGEIVDSVAARTETALHAPVIATAVGAITGANSAPTAIRRTEFS